MKYKCIVKTFKGKKMIIHLARPCENLLIAWAFMGDIFANNIYDNVVNGTIDDFVITIEKDKKVIVTGTPTVGEFPMKYTLVEGFVEIFDDEKEIAFSTIASIDNQLFEGGYYGEIKEE